MATVDIYDFLDTLVAENATQNALSSAIKYAKFMEKKAQRVKKNFSRNAMFIYNDMYRENGGES